MTAPEWLINTFIRFGLKDSEEKRLKRRIAASQEKIRSIRQQADNIVNEIKSIEAECREAKTEYDALHGVARETVRIRIDSLLKARERFSERNDLLAQQLNAEMAILQDLQLRLDYQLSRSRDELEEAIDEKDDLVAELDENEKVADRLKRPTSSNSANSPKAADKQERTTSTNSTDSPKDDYDEKFKDFN
ncbi:MAG: hypothetical protein J6X49_00305 [Victivallales bacterium]|nr:hypothetical protein [Victivallales bacterium]